MAKLKGAFTWLESHHGALGVILTVIGGLYLYFYEYLPAQHEHAVAETIKYIERLQQSPLMDARARLEYVLLRDDVQERMRAVRDIPDQTLRYAKEDEILSDVLKKNEKLQADLLSLRAFYISAVQCANSGVCDKETACDFFLEPMRDLRVNHSAFLREWGQKLRQHFPDRIDPKEEYLETSLGKSYLDFIAACEKRTACSTQANRC